MPVQLNSDTNDAVVDVSEHFDCHKAERKGANVLIMRELDEPHERFDKKRAKWELEYRWLSHELAELCEVKGSEISYWTDSEYEKNIGLFDQFNLF